MKYILHKAESRGLAEHGWLTSRHTFSFADYYNPDRVHFGRLRVLNDDIVQPAKGFGMHPHENMEIITIPITGSLEHKDSMGTGSIIKTGDIQIMSAGTGVMHSEFNPSTEELVNFLQIWVFPEKKDIAPRYDQKTYDLKERNNQFQELISPVKTEKTLWINQQAWFSMTKTDKDATLNYELRDEKNGIYLFIIEGTLNFENLSLNRRDGIGLWDLQELEMTAKKDTEILIMEIPIN
jgi:quercetin 2,3-dioxygenase